MGLDGKPRQLHLEESIACLDPKPRAGLKPLPVLVAQGRELLCATPWFALERLRPGPGVALAAREGFQILQVLDAPATLRWADGERKLERGGCVLLPSDLPVTVCGGTWLRSFVPDLERDVVGPVVASGASREAAMALTAGTFET